MSDQFFKNIISQTAENVQGIIAAENRARMQQEAEDMKHATTVILEWFARFKDYYYSFDSIWDIINMKRDRINMNLPASISNNSVKVQLILETLAQNGYLVKAMREKKTWRMPDEPSDTVMCYQYNSKLLQN